MFRNIWLYIVRNVEFRFPFMAEKNEVFTSYESIEAFVAVYREIIEYFDFNTSLFDEDTKGRHLTLTTTLNVEEFGEHADIFYLAIKAYNPNSPYASVGKVIFDYYNFDDSSKGEHGINFTFADAALRRHSGLYYKPGVLHRYSCSDISTKQLVDHIVFGKAVTFIHKLYEAQLQNNVDDGLTKDGVNGLCHVYADVLSFLKIFMVKNRPPIANDEPHKIILPNGYCYDRYDHMDLFTAVRKNYDKSKKYCSVLKTVCEHMGVSKVTTYEALLVATTVDSTLRYSRHSLFKPYSMTKYWTEKCGLTWLKNQAFDL